MRGECLYKEIKLSNGGVTIVDEKNFDWLNQWTWREEAGYVIRGETQANGRKKKIRMHRQIMGFPENMAIDHINRVRHDNREENLRICTSAENSMNIVKNRNLKTVSNYKGVQFRNKTWRARLNAHTKSYNIGSFDSELAAANAYNYYSKKYCGEYSVPNDCPYMSKEEWESHRLIRKKSNKHSEYVGVGWYKAKKMWRAYVKDKHLGFHDDEKFASYIRDLYIIHNNLDLKLNHNIKIIK